jgi:hypothetical protein
MVQLLMTILGHLAVIAIGQATNLPRQELEQSVMNPRGRLKGSRLVARVPSSGATFDVGQNCSRIAPGVFPGVFRDSPH